MVEPKYNIKQFEEAVERYNQASEDEYIAISVIRCNRHRKVKKAFGYITCPPDGRTDVMWDCEGRCFVFDEDDEEEERVYWSSRLFLGDLHL